jgi:ABC-type multidrug transport system ATPase subunit
VPEVLLNAIPKEIPMKILTCNSGKRYNKEWIFKDFSYEFADGIAYAITGPNGSGKSTLLQCLAGATHLSKGSIQYYLKEKEITADKTFLHLSFAAPYLELLEELTLEEMLNFHQKFKPFYGGITNKEAAHIVGLATSMQKQIGNFSSGMKQRLKLALAFFSNTQLLLLDEPTANLDAKGVALYQDLILEYRNNRTTIISSNDKEEYNFCKEVIIIEDYKPIAFL